MDHPAGSQHQTPLHERHVALGAKMADFSGWDMPIEYAGGGVAREHTAVRESVGVFDVSHLGKASVRGVGARGLVNAALTNDLDKVQPGAAQYSMCCDSESGGVVDDLIVYLRGDDDVFLVPNAANNAEVVRRLSAASGSDLTVTNEHEVFGVIAVQGPRSAAVLDVLGLPNDHDYMSFVDSDWRGIALTVCRSGYTGEHGYELVVPWDATVEVWDALLGPGIEWDVRACGLGSRDTLRTEMGYPLHGHELSLDITPVQARAGWAVGWDKPTFWGKDALLAERTRGPSRVLRALRAQQRAIPRPHMAVTATDGAPLGEVTSGTFSPTLGQGIALALVDPAVKVGDEVLVDVRGKPAPFAVVATPMVASHVR